MNFKVQFCLLNENISVQPMPKLPANLLESKYMTQIIDVQNFMRRAL